MVHRSVVRVLTRAGARLGLDREWYLLTVAALLGLLMGVAAVGFIEPIQWLEDQAATLSKDHGLLMKLLVLLAPVTGGLLTALVFLAIPARFRGHGVTRVIYAVNRERSRLPFLLAVRHWLASTFTIGSGGSAGPEGPIVAIGATIGSTVGRFLGTAPPETATLLGCGAAAGLAAVFNAPLAGIFFVLEVILRDFSLRTFTPIVVAAVMSTATAQTVLGSRQPLFGVGPSFFEGHNAVFTVSQAPAFALLGVVAAVAAVIFGKSMHVAHRLFEKIPGSGQLRPVYGAAILGLLGLAWVIASPSLAVWSHSALAQSAVPPFYGTGYDAVHVVLENSFYAAPEGGASRDALLLAFGVLLAGAFLKTIATGLTIGSGGAGGLFAPSLLLGAMIGGAFGAIAEVTGIAPAAQPAYFALVGMACMVAATTHAPLTGVLLVYELTRSYTIMLPLMLAAVMSTIVSRVLYHDSVYTAELRALGVRLGAIGDLAVLRRLTVSDLELLPPVQVGRDDNGERLLELSERFHVEELVVADSSGGYLGMITSGDLRAAVVFREALPLLQAGELERSDIPVLHATDTLDLVLDRFSRHDVQSLPVVNAAGTQVIGMVSRSRLMQRYQSELERPQ